jgi:uncharacterized protein with ParB-like and HNH nuclease domain
MISEKHIQSINKIISNIIFDYVGEISHGLEIEFKYQFVITGQRKMISVGEYYDYLDVLVEITDGDKRVTTIFSVFKTLKDSLLKDYKLNYHLTYLIDEELKYFFEGDGARVRIVKIQFSDDYNEKIENTVDEL